MTAQVPTPTPTYVWPPLAPMLGVAAAAIGALGLLVLYVGMALADRSVPRSVRTGHVAFSDHSVSDQLFIVGGLTFVGAVILAVVAVVIVVAARRRGR